MRSALGNIDDLGDGRYRVRIELAWDPRTGKRRRIDRTIRGTRSDAERLRAVLLMGLGKGDAHGMTLATYLEDVWMPSKASRRRLTLRGYQSKINVNIVPYIGQLPLENVNGYVVERWMVDLQRDGKSAQTIINARSVLKNAMRSAVRWRLIDLDPTEGTELPRVDYTPDVLTAEQLGAYVDAFSGHVLEPAIVTMIATGLRRSEAFALEWSDFDFDDGTVFVHRGIHQEGSAVWFEPTKSKTSKRLLALDEWALDILRPLRGTGPIVGDSGHHMAPEKALRLYETHITKKTDLPYVPLRNLRNSIGTFLADAGVDVADISSALGHSTVEVTRQHYIVRSHRLVNRAAVVRLPNRSTQRGTSLRDKHELDDTKTESGCAESL